jgi:hypothetical protein
MSDFCATDDGPLEICWEASYELLDDHTLAAQEGPWRTVFTFSLDRGVLALDIVESNDEAGMAPLTATFETLPFTRMP